MKMNATEDEQSRSDVRTLALIVADWLPIVLVSTIFCIGNLLVPMTFQDVQIDDPIYMEIFFCYGILAAEVGLLSTMAVFGVYGFFQRASLACVLLGFAATMFVFGIGRGDLPTGPAVFIYGIAIGGFSFNAILLMIFRRYSGVAILSETASEKIEDQAAFRPASFSVANLIVLMAVSALLVLLVRNSVSWELIIGPIPMDFTLAAMIFLCNSSATFLPCLWLALTQRHKTIAGFVLAIVFAGASPITLALLDLLPPIANSLWNSNAILHLYSYSAGLICASIIVLLGCRVLGFRLISMRQLTSNH
ncbi:MAG: hypothetical protein ABL921_02725 [Pirellula sp.]